MLKRCKEVLDEPLEMKSKTKRIRIYNWMVALRYGIYEFIE